MDARGGRGRLERSIREVSLELRAILLVLTFLFSGVLAAQDPTPGPVGPEQVDSGTILNYEEGRNIVIRRPDGSQIVYPLASNVNWPPELKMYGWVNVYFEPLQGGGFHVTRLTTVLPAPTAVPPTPTLPPPSPPPALPSASQPAPSPIPVRTGPKGAPVKLSMENSVTIIALEPGRRMTVRGRDGIKRTYLLDASSLLPPKLSVQQRVILETKTVDGAQVVSRVVYPEIVISNVPKK